MNTNALQHRHAAIKVLPGLIAAALLCPLAASAGPADASDHQGARGAKALEGTWDITATIRDCVTGAEIRSIPRMITFAKGGTLFESAAGGTALFPVTRAVGHGAWEYRGQHTFAYSLKFMRLTSFGGPDGFIQESRMLQVDSSGDSFAADGTSHIFFANGTVSPLICTSEAGTRLF
ncbi:MAG: hypothetical protein CVV14_04855 [Gammaproteobacteria bacterium HGW-Gammaproteobacteria-4]|jgi:hypothetical protein|nr:MAG: hypothetical protein CVV14_04855 [Gammaproteobacteria bacterium HGW-Gammaproteobacteria-4]